MVEMERINENLIKIHVAAADLEARGLSFIDLISGQEQAERFFYSILEEVDVDDHFKDSEAVTFQIIPSKDGLELYISSIDFDQEEAMQEQLIRIFESRFKEAKANFAARQGQDSGSAEAKEEKGPAMEAEVFHGALCFDSLEDFLQLARSVQGPGYETELYYYKQSYYLVFHMSQEDEALTSLVKDFAKFLDYGHPADVAPAVLEEYGRCIYSGDCLTYFGQHF